MQKPKKLRIDIETFSGENIKNGLFKYINHSEFEVLLFSFACDDDNAVCVDLKQGQRIPQYVIDWIYDPSVIKTAWKADFEIACLGRYFNRALDASQWRCTMVKAAYNGYPMSLDAAGKALKLDVLKMKEGKDLIRLFCVPCRPSKKNLHRYRNLPEHFPDKWLQFKRYCNRDVNVEKHIDNTLLFDLPTREQAIYAMDQRINKTGLLCDRNFVNNVIHINTTYREHLITRAKILTGVDNPNSVKQLKTWLEEETDEYIPSLDKKAVEQLRKMAQPEKVDELLHIRQELALSSVKKYQKMLDMATASGHLLYQFQYYGATNTGRWASRGVQLHNLARNKMKLPELTYLRNLVKNGVDHHTLSLLYDSPSSVLKELIRTAFIPGVGSKFVIGDFSAIEAVVLAWLSSEQWRLNAFKQKKDIYIASASRMFRIPESEIDDDGPIRQRGKVAELALGYQGASGALLKMGALDMGIQMRELEPIVAQWRAANKSIVQAWYTTEKAFKYALLNPGEIVAVFGGKLRFRFYRGKMLMRLPSGRYLVYDSPELIENRLTCYRQNQKTKQWMKHDLYGGLLIENAVQAIARDLLADAMLRVDKRYVIGLHVHDEIGCVVDENDNMAVSELERLMSELPEWGKDIPVRAKVFEASFYRKG